MSRSVVFPQQSRADNKRTCGSDRRTKLHCSWANRGQPQSLGQTRASPDQIDTSTRRMGTHITAMAREGDIPPEPTSILKTAIL